MIPLVEIPKINTPGMAHLVRMLQNDRFMVQVYELNKQIRLSICRIDINPDGRRQDGITWDELQELKYHAGYGNECAVEIYPPDDNIVNVANMRHLWIIQPPDFMWRPVKAIVF